MTNCASRDASPATNRRGTLVSLNVPVFTAPCDVNVRDAAAKLKPGEMSAPIRSDYGWHLIKCLDKQEVTFEEAQDAIYVNLIHDRKKDLADELTGKAKIEE